MGLFNRLLQQQIDEKRAMNKKTVSYEGPFQIDIKEDGVTSRYERANFATERMDKFNSDVMSWAQKTGAGLKASVGSAGIKGRMLRSSIRPNYKKDKGEIFRVGFKFVRHGVFVEKGVGRGYKMTGTVITRTAKSKPVKERKGKPWFNPVIERNLPELVNIVKDYSVDAVINTTRIFIR